MTIVQTTAGRVRGDGNVFRGIPFAAMPVGPNRFRPPQPVTRWDGVRDATAFGPGCHQVSLDPDPRRSAFFNPAITGEDCLNLNVWTPDPGAAGLPVMVWIHGGGYLTGGGAAPIHDGATWASDGVVYVSINYRLHVEGFLNFGGDAVNLGLQDQVAALRWVHDNITAFGGDPDNVTVFGQSAGGVSVMSLLAMPSARGLFRRAIAQSGSTVSECDDAFAQRVVHRLAEMLGVAPTADGFRDLSSDRVLAAVANLAMEFISPSLWGADSFRISPFRTVIDGTVLPDGSVASVARGSVAGVDLMAGVTRDECTFALQPLGMLHDPPEVWVEAALDAMGVSRSDLDIYKTHRPGADLGELMQAAWTDWAFRMPTIAVLDAHATAPGRGRTYGYEFQWPSPTFPELGATHALEVPFVNDALDAAVAELPAAENQFGTEPPARLAATMHKAWIDFATTGSPGWPAYDAADRTAMQFNVASAPLAGWGHPERELWLECGN